MITCYVIAYLLCLILLIIRVLRSMCDGLGVKGIAASDCISPGSAITVVIKGFDAVLNDDICAFHRYRVDDLVLGHNQFGDVINYGSVDFKTFHDIVPQKLPSINIARPQMDTPDIVYLLNGAIPSEGVCC